MNEREEYYYISSVYPNLLKTAKGGLPQFYFIFKNLNPMRTDFIFIECFKNRCYFVHKVTTGQGGYKVIKLSR